MYAKTDLFDRQQAKDERKRLETKKELKSLLTKYIGPDRAKYAVQHAQHKMGVMHERMAKATKEMRKINNECKCRVFRRSIGSLIFIVYSCCDAEVRSRVGELQRDRQIQYDELREAADCGESDQVR